MSTPDLGLPSGKTPNDPFLTQAEVDATSAAILNLFAGFLSLDVAGSAHVTVDEDEDARNSILTLTGVLTGSINLVLPTWDGKRWLIVNNTTGNFSVTAKTAAGAGIAITQGFGAVVYCDGTDIKRETVDQAAGTLRITSPRIVTSILDANGNELLNLTATASAVNEFTLINGATGVGPILEASGESNVDATFRGKGTGATNLGRSGGKLGFFGATAVTKPTALTAANAGALNTGDATSDTVIGNMRTRLGELETKLQALGLLT
jgi:hypothetical protein